MGIHIVGGAMFAFSDFYEGIERRSYPGDCGVNYMPNPKYQDNDESNTEDNTKENKHIKGGE